MLLWSLVLSVLTILPSCSKLNPLSLLKPNGVTANVQAGAENNQTIGQTNQNSIKLVRPQARDIKQTQDTTQVKAENVEKIVNNENSILLILIAIIGWIAPSPGEIAKRIKGLWRKTQG
jgi:hypothetical protein|tara:strand:+ start:1979 stop:2335 length:357 start_codon:yes stop_codon:yes gene_type:complete